MMVYLLLFPFHEHLFAEMSSDCMYRLRGVVVHSGQATGGHYYSFIKSSDDQKWYKFDDTDVSHYECDLKDVKNKWYAISLLFLLSFDDIGMVEILSMTLIERRGPDVGGMRIFCSMRRFCFNNHLIVCFVV